MGGLLSKQPWKSRQRGKKDPPKWGPGIIPEGQNPDKGGGGGGGAIRKIYIFDYYQLLAPAGVTQQEI